MRRQICPGPGPGPGPAPAAVHRSGALRRPLAADVARRGGRAAGAGRRRAPGRGRENRSGGCRGNLLGRVPAAARENERRRPWERWLGLQAELRARCRILEHPVGTPRQTPAVRVTRALWKGTSPAYGFIFSPRPKFPKIWFGLKIALRRISALLVLNTRLYGLSAWSSVCGHLHRSIHGRKRYPR